MNRALRVSRDGFATPREAMTDFLESLRGTSRRPNTIIYYQSAVRQMVAWMEEESYQLGDLDNRRVRAYFVYREEECEVSRTTLYHDWTATRAYLRHCRRSGWIDDDPMGDLRFRKPRAAPPDVPSESTVMALLQAIRDRWNPKINRGARWTSEKYRVRIMRRDYCLVLALFETGARRGEIVNLTTPNLCDLDTQAPYLMLRDTKTGQDRWVFVSLDWVEAWKAYQRVRPKAGGPHETIWHGEYGGSLSAAWLTRKIKEYRDWAKLPAVTAQHLRRYRASRLIQNKTDLYAAAEILGNSPEVLRRNYLEKNQAHLRERWEASMATKAVVTAKTARRRRD